MSWTKVGANFIAEPFTLIRSFRSTSFTGISSTLKGITIPSLQNLELSHSKPVDLSFPLALKEFPELAEKGAYSSSKTYSAKDLDNVVAYANSVS